MGLPPLLHQKGQHYWSCCDTPESCTDTLRALCVCIQACLCRQLELGLRHPQGLPSPWTPSVLQGTMQSLGELISQTHSSAQFMGAHFSLWFNSWLL